MLVSFTRIVRLDHHGHFVVIHRCLVLYIMLVYRLKWEHKITILGANILEYNLQILLKAPFTLKKPKYCVQSHFRLTFTKLNHWNAKSFTLKKGCLTKLFINLYQIQSRNVDQISLWNLLFVVCISNTFEIKLPCSYNMCCKLRYKYINQCTYILWRNEGKTMPFIDVNWLLLRYLKHNTL